MTEGPWTHASNPIYTATKTDVIDTRKQCIHHEFKSQQLPLPLELLSLKLCFINCYTAYKTQLFLLSSQRSSCACTFVWGSVEPLNWSFKWQRSRCMQSPRYPSPIQVGNVVWHFQQPAGLGTLTNALALQINHHLTTDYDSVFNLAIRYAVFAQSTVTFFYLFV